MATPGPEKNNPNSPVSLPTGTTGAVSPTNNNARGLGGETEAAANGDASGDNEDGRNADIINYEQGLIPADASILHRQCRS